MDQHRFSAFWLRSKCSICSYQLNIWYDPHWGSMILNWFLNLGEETGACSDFPAGWPGIAVPPGSAHSPLGELSQNKKSTPPSTLSPLAENVTRTVLSMHTLLCSVHTILIWFTICCKQQPLSMSARSLYSSSNTRINVSSTNQEVCSTLLTAIVQC